MIRTFRDRATLEFWRTGKSRRLAATISKIARRKLALLDAATRLIDLASPPGNRLEALVGDRSGQHSIRINDQYRVCFVWRNGDAYDVEIADYH